MKYSNERFFSGEQVERLDLDINVDRIFSFTTFPRRRGTATKTNLLQFTSRRNVFMYTVKETRDKLIENGFFLRTINGMFFSRKPTGILLTDGIGRPT